MLSSSIYTCLKDKIGREQADCRNDCMRNYEMVFYSVQGLDRKRLRRKVGPCFSRDMRASISPWNFRQFLAFSSDFARQSLPWDRRQRRSTLQCPPPRCAKIRPIESQNALAAGAEYSSLMKCVLCRLRDVPTVTFRVGAGRTFFPVHTDLLCDASPVFGAAFTRNFQEQSTQTIKGRAVALSKGF